MTRQARNRIRGTFLLLVFCLNTVAGFACSIGADMGYNQGHHERAEEYCHSEHHDAAPASEEDCCANEVADFIQLDKSVAGVIQLQAPVFWMTFVTSFLVPEPVLTSVSDPLPPINRRSRTLAHDTDLRIVIQSFQI